jgi:hypothetical protein
MNQTITRLVLALTLALFAAPAMAQLMPGGAVGVGSGASAIDPSKNVLDALLAAVTRLNDLREVSEKREDDLRKADDRFHVAQLAAETRHTNDMRESEKRRTDDLATQKQNFDLELAHNIRATVEDKAALLAAQVKELKMDTSDRIAKLEVYANETRGRSSATDPANVQLYADVNKLKAIVTDSGGVGTGRTDMVGWIAAGVFGVLMLLVAAGGLFFSIAERRSNAGNQHDHEDAERYRRSVEHKVTS